MKGVPVLVQSSRTECGVACLAMVLTHHGHEISIRETLAECATGRDGASAGALARAARRLGLSAKGYRTEDCRFDEIHLPAIAHWGSDHFVVVESVGARRVSLVDPRFGRRRITLEEFRAGLGQAVIELWPRPDFVKRRSGEGPFWRTYLRSLLHLPGTRWLLAQVLLASLVLQGLGLATPLIVRQAVDGLTTLRDTSVLTLLGVGIGVIALGQLLAGYLRSALVLHVQGRLDTHASLGVGGHLLRLPLHYFQQRSTGDILTRVGSIIALREQLTGQTLGSFLDAGLVTSYLVLLAFLDPEAALIVLAALVIQLVLLIRAVGRIRELMATDVSTHAESQGHLVEALQGISTLKASAAEDLVLQRWVTLFLNWMRASIRRNQAIGLLDAVSGTLRVLTPLLVLWFGTMRVLDGTLTAGTMLAATWMSASVVASVSSVSSNAQRVQLAGVQLQRLGDALETEPEFSAAPPLGKRPLSGRIELREVTFGYDIYSPPALFDLSVTVEPGQRVAVVGRTGAGKTTLGLLLLGLYPPTSGEILVDGVPVADYDPRLLRSGYGVVLQEPFVFAGTIHDNLTFQDPSISRADVEEAAALAALHEEISALPKGYDTRLGERGTGLSGGQRQRLALARALVRRPPILLLDEATSHLDAATEARITRNLQDLCCTQIVIAHRLSTVVDADLILMLDGGRLAEYGTHEQLLAQEGPYAALIGAQLTTRSTLT